LVAIEWTNLEQAVVMPRWRVDIRRKNAEQLGIVAAPNAKEALARAVTFFRIDQSQHNKLTITKVDSGGAMWDPD